MRSLEISTIRMTNSEKDAFMCLGFLIQLIETPSIRHSQFDTLDSALKPNVNWPNVNWPIVCESLLEASPAQTFLSF